MVAKLSLARVMTEAGVIPLPRTLDVIGQIAAALEAARAQGIVVADLHPGAILLEEGPGAGLRVIGFEQPDERLASRLGEGRLRYMPPEAQVLATPDADERADQFSLAAIAFKMLSGRSPFNEDDLERAADAGRDCPPSGVRDLSLLTMLAFELPRSVDAVLLRAMSFDPGDRFPHVDDFVAALRAEATQYSARPSRHTAALGVLACIVVVAGALAAAAFRSRTNGMLPPADAAVVPSPSPAHSRGHHGEIPPRAQRSSTHQSRVLRRSGARAPL